MGLTWIPGADGAGPGGLQRKQKPWRPPTMAELGSLAENETEKFLEVLRLYGHVKWSMVFSVHY